MHYVLLSLKNQSRKTHHRLYSPWNHYRAVNMTGSRARLSDVLDLCSLSSFVANALIHLWMCVCPGCSWRQDCHLCRQSWAGWSTSDSGGELAQASAQLRIPLWIPRASPCCWPLPGTLTEDMKASSVCCRRYQTAPSSAMQTCLRPYIGSARGVNNL